MMKKSLLHALLLLVFAGAMGPVTQAQQHRPYVIRGKVIDRNDRVLLLADPFVRFDRQHDSIPIVDGAFEYAFHGEAETARKLIFGSELERGTFRSIDFFLDRDTIDMWLYPTERFEENRVSGGPLNDELGSFNSAFAATFEPRFHTEGMKRDSLYNAGNYYSEQHNTLMEALRDADMDQRVLLYRQRDSLEKAGLDLTEDGNRLRDVMVALQHEAATWRNTYIAEKPSPVTLFFLMNDLYYYREDSTFVQSVARVYPDHAARFPDHPYTADLEGILRGVLGVSVEGHLIDFEAPDLTGTSFRLSDLLTEKVTLVDFWGSWCGPCIAKSRTMVPLYAQYKEKGFGVVGIAREFKNTRALRQRLEQEAFNWVNLVELDDQQGIWKMYGMSNASGMMLLVDQAGEILAVNPTADEVSQLLGQLL